LKRSGPTLFGKPAYSLLGQSGVQGHRRSGRAAAGCSKRVEGNGNL